MKIEQFNCVSHNNWEEINVLAALNFYFCFLLLVFKEDTFKILMKLNDLI